MPEIDTAETSDGTAPPPAAELASTAVRSSFAFFCNETSKGSDRTQGWCRTSAAEGIH